MSNSFRIRTEVGVDKALQVNLEQDFDFLEILSLMVPSIITFCAFLVNPWAKSLISIELLYVLKYLYGKTRKKNTRTA